MLKLVEHGNKRGCDKLAVHQHLLQPRLVLQQQCILVPCGACGSLQRVVWVDVLHVFVRLVSECCSVGVQFLSVRVVLAYGDKLSALSRGILQLLGLVLL